VTVGPASWAGGGVTLADRLPRVGGVVRGLEGPAAAAALLGIARLLPETGFGLWLRLAAATLIVLLPGRLVAVALGQRTLAAALAWSVALVGCGLALAFALGASLDVTLAFSLAAGAAALGARTSGYALAEETTPVRARAARPLLALAGLGLGAALWSIAGVLSGDSFFHLGRIRKLDALGSLSLHDVGEFAHGGLHPGYAFPLWHGWMALVARVAGVDPTSVAVHESSLLVPLALVLAFEMGWAVFRSAGLAVAVVLAEVSLEGLTPQHGGVYPLLWQPGSAAHFLLMPATVVLFFAFIRNPAWPTALALAAVSGSIALVHPTYAVFLSIVLAAFVAVRALLTRGTDLQRGVLSLVAVGVPQGLAWIWLQPITAQTVALHLGPKSLMRSLHHFRTDLVISSLSRYALSPQLIDRAGPVAIAALVLVPLAFFDRRRRWSALVLGSAVTLLALELWPVAFPHFSNFLSLSQSRRAYLFIPFAVALAGGASVLARLSRPLALALALAFGIWLELAYPGNFGVRVAHTAPSLAAWFALYGGAAAIVAGTVLAWRRREPVREGPRRRSATAALATLLFVLPVAVQGFASWSAPQSKAFALTPGLIRFLQRDVPAQSVVFADLETSYRAVAYAPVYVVGVPPSHVANTKPNRVPERKHAVLRFLHTHDLAIPRNWHAGWLVLRRRDEPFRAIERQGLRPVYQDGGFVVFRL
jgi:hypothetical protein